MVEYSVSVIPGLSSAAAAILGERGFYMVCVRGYLRETIFHTQVVVPCPFRATCPAKQALDAAEVEDHDGIIGEFVDPVFVDHP